MVRTRTNRIWEKCPHARDLPFFLGRTPEEFCSADALAETLTLRFSPFRGNLLAVGTGQWGGPRGQDGFRFEIWLKRPVAKWVALVETWTKTGLPLLFKN